MWSSFDPSVVVVNPVRAFVEPAEVDGAKVDVPGPVGEGLKADGESCQQMRDVHPVGVPTDSTVGGDFALFEMRWVVGGRDAGGQGTS